jgi:hypothetical protein
VPSLPHVTNADIYSSLDFGGGAQATLWDRARENLEAGLLGAELEL